MKRVVWATDIHLNFLGRPERRVFAESIVHEAPDAVLLSGDMAESRDLVDCLEEMAEIVRRPIYFVLGNHDFYRGSITRTRQEVARAAAESEFLVYLNTQDVVELTPETALVGHDGWGDARLGDYRNSDLVLSDFVLIDDLVTWDDDPEQLDREALAEKLRVLGDEAAHHFARVLPEALAAYPRVVAVTHVPPFREAAWYDGKPSSDAWLPFFACKAAGDCMLEAMRARPDRQLLVLCGHTHGSGEIRMLDNLEVLTGGARYRHPAIGRVFEFA